MFPKIEKYRRTHCGDMLFSILIPTWNNLEYLKLCVESITKNSAYKHQIIVMVNEGRDGSLEWVKSLDYVDFVYCSENLGICYGLNACRSLITTQYVLYANDDMYFAPDWDVSLYEEIKKIGHPYFLLSGTMVERLGNNPCCVIADYGDSAATFREDDFKRDIPKLKRDNWAGSTWPPSITSLDVWDLIGGMSIEFSPGMYSDPDMAMKMWIAGVRVFQGLGDSLVYHFGCKSTKRIKRNKGQYTFLRKWKISAGLLFSHYLRRGENLPMPLPEPKKINLGKRIKERWKRLINS